MGISQSDIEQIDYLKRNYGSLKNTQDAIIKSLDKLDVERALIEQNFQKQQTDIKNTVDELKKQLREMKHEYAISLQHIDEEQGELRCKAHELQVSIGEIKIAEMRTRRGSMLRHKHM